MVVMAGVRAEDSLLVGSSNLKGVMVIKILRLSIFLIIS
jgi:hypothetical protein